jgi:hypothetical protein
MFQWLANNPRLKRGQIGGNVRQFRHVYQLAASVAISQRRIAAQTLWYTPPDAKGLT